MAFDGFTIAALVSEMDAKLTGGHIQKIAQPEADELLLSIKNNKTQYKLQISASPSLPLIHLTNSPKPSPFTAPGFCMLLRKHLGGAKILSFEQVGLERVIRIQLENLNELGDVVQKSLMVEIMGKHSNIILVDEKNTIVDSIKHINGLTSSVRQVLPGLDYFIPNTQHKINPYEVTTNDWNETLFIKPVSIAKMLYGSLSGFSSSLSHELAYRCRLDGDAPTASLNGNDKSALMERFRSLMQKTKEKDFSPCIVFRGAKPIDFGAFSFTMYTDCTCKIYESMSEVVETFYGEKDTLERIRQKSIDLRKSVTNILERNYKKRDMQYKQLKKTEGKEKYKVYGELLTTYGYQLSESDTSLTCVNYYNNEEITIPVDETMTAIENANKYFARYNKLKRTEEAVKEQQEETEETITHLESIMTELDIARKEEDLVVIRQELSDFGYMKEKRSGKKGKPIKKSKPLHFISSDGYDIFVGKNNYQNDELTFKTATVNDWWFHAKNMPGSHVIVKTNGEEPPIKTFEEAGSLAAYFSKGKGADKVEIDYTQKKNVKKPNGGKPGFVVYYTNYSLMASSHIEGIRCVNAEDSVFLERSYV